MTPIKASLADPWRSDDDADLPLGEAEHLRPPTMLRCTILDSDPVRRMPVELKRLEYLGAGVSDGFARTTPVYRRRYGFYVYTRDGAATVQRLLIILETSGDQTNGFVLPESVIDTFAELARYSSPSQLWDIGFTLSIARNDKHGLLERFPLGEYD